MKKWAKGLIEKLKNHFRAVIKIKKSPHSIALGFAIGTFISILPTPGLNILIGLLIVLIYKKINKFSLFGAVFFWNVLTTTPIYFLSYKLGNFLFASKPVNISDFSLIGKIYHFSASYLAGNIIMAAICSAASYLLIRLFLEYRRKKRVKIT